MENYGNQVCVPLRAGPGVSPGGGQKCVLQALELTGLRCVTHPDEGRPCRRH